ncbi:hypothetical protein O6H91_22G013900 [Diphasiastrum complanatum]|uniref:Uncharacterized protein n=1 Tax=Diphasiastrum complanatum TaxID=34168 RepID=A0ACC2AD51_DIPCM|nr:hypothetical protein O6H91_22G013900 [Diphasiastrum complanatum]
MVMESPKEHFPAGLKVLVVDDDPTCLFHLDAMLRRCSYSGCHPKFLWSQVRASPWKPRSIYDVLGKSITTCGRATKALEMLRENKKRFDLVISDVYMPDMDGFKLLELVGLEMDLPVIMMSADGETSLVMKGVTHGACDYLLKPVRMEELRNIWQHVVRKKRIEAKDVEDSERQKREFEDGDHASSSNSKKRKDVKTEEEDDDNYVDDPLTLKKPRVVWSVELHQQFVRAVNQLGIDKAVPKRILELMNVQGLTRENVASHLQKFRLYLKRISVQPNNSTSLSMGIAEESPFGPMNTIDILGDLRSLVATGSMSPQAFATSQSSALSRLSLPNGLVSGGYNASVLRDYAAAVQSGNYSRLNKPLTSTGNFVPNIAGMELDQLSHTQLSSPRHLGSPMDNSTGLYPLQQQLVTTCGPPVTGTSGTLSSSQAKSMMQFLQQQQQQQQQQKHNFHQQQDVVISNLPVAGGLASETNLAQMNTISTMGIENGGMRSEAGLSTLVACENKLFVEHKDSRLSNAADSKTTNMEAKNLNSFAVSKSSEQAGSSAISTFKGTSGLRCTAMKNLYLGQHNTINNRSGGSHADMLVGSNCGSQTTKLGLQNQGLTVWQASGKPFNLDLCSPFSQVSIGKQNTSTQLSNGRGQAQAFVSTRVDLTQKLPDSELMKHLTGSHGYNENFLVDNNLQTMEDHFFGLKGSARLEAGVPLVQGLSSEDLMSLFLKEQQTGAFMEGDFGIDALHQVISLSSES